MKAFWERAGGEVAVAVDWATAFVPGCLVFSSFFPVGVPTVFLAVEAPDALALLVFPEPTVVNEEECVMTGLGCALSCLWLRGGGGGGGTGLMRR
jgi:hypothetical protein